MSLLNLSNSRGLKTSPNFNCGEFAIIKIFGHPRLCFSPTPRESYGQGPPCQVFRGNPGASRYTGRNSNRDYGFCPNHTSITCRLCISVCPKDSFGVSENTNTGVKINHSKIDKLGYVIKDGVKSKNFWDGKIRSNIKPKRLKVRNISGDETIISIQ